jgi:hypothetical protein
MARAEMSRDASLVRFCAVNENETEFPSVNRVVDWGTMSLSADLVLCTRTQLNKAKYIETHFEKGPFAILFHLIPERPVFSNKTPILLHDLNPKCCFYYHTMTPSTPCPQAKMLVLLVHPVSSLQRYPRGCCSYVARHEEVHVQLGYSIYIDAVPVAAKHVYYILRIAL